MDVQERPGGPGTQVLTMRRFLIFVASLAFLPAMVQAQGRGGGGRGMGAAMGHPAMAGPSMAGHAMSAPHFAPRASEFAGSRYSYGYRAYPGMRYVRTRPGALVARPLRQASPLESARASRPLLSQDVVPGLGFDYAHVAAVHPEGSHGRGRGHGRNGGFVGAYFPFYGGGYYLPLYSDDLDDEEAEAPPEEVQPVDNGEEETRQTAENEIPATPSQDYVPARPAAPQETDQYVFVRRDGTLFFAVAYSWENGTLRYITSEGIRHTTPQSTLDLNATQQFNQQRGLNFSLPA
jgi:hypothetical protein